MAETRYQIDAFQIEIYSVDRKGGRTRWGDRKIRLFSRGKEVAQAVFAKCGEKCPEPYFAEGKIFYFASSSQYPDVLDLLRHENPVFICWNPVHDPKESQDGDAFFTTKAPE